MQHRPQHHCRSSYSWSKLVRGIEYEEWSDVFVLHSVLRRINFRFSPTAVLHSARCVPGQDSSELRHESPGHSRSSADTAKICQPGRRRPSQEKYAWRPGDGARTFGEVFLHTAAAGFNFPAMKGALAAPDFTAKGFEKSTTDKAKIIEWLNKSFAYSIASMRSMSNADFATPLRKLEPKPTPATLFISWSFLLTSSWESRSPTPAPLEWSRLGRRTPSRRKPTTLPH
jgi:hypothetical protein